MRLATIRVDGGTTCVVLRDGSAIELPYEDVGALLAGDPGWRDADAARRAREHDALSADWAPLVTRPGKIICLGQNYRQHIAEMGRDLPSHPTLFAKFRESLLGARDRLTLPRVAAQPDWEAELGVVVGRRVRRESPERCADAIAGYTVVNDVTMRDWQRRTTQWLQGKTFEGCTPVGPLLVTPDEVDDARDLRITCCVDDETMQDSSTSDMLFTPEVIISYASMVLTLEPGDLLSTGTPAGVGDARTPPQYLRPGQLLRTAVESIGELRNLCVEDTGPPDVA